MKKCFYIFTLGCLLCSCGKILEDFASEKDAAFPTAEFTSPTENITVSDSVSLSLAFSNLDSDDTIGIRAIGASDEEIYTVATNLAPTNSLVTWSTIDVPEDTYRLALNVTTSTTTYKFLSSFLIEIDTSIENDDAPTWEGEIFDLLQPSCSSSECHSTGGDWAHTYVSDQYSTGDSLGSFDLRDRVLLRILDGTMPPPGEGYPSLTDSEVSSLQDWINSGAAEN